MHDEFETTKELLKECRDTVSSNKGFDIGKLIGTILIIFLFLKLIGVI